MRIIVVMSTNASGATWPQALPVPLLLLMMTTMPTPLTAEHLQSLPAVSSGLQTTV
jgi:hypothetical protein